MKSVSKSGKPRLGRKLYKYSVHKRWLTMPDGVKLAASLFIPKAERKGETFPVLLEYLPYRKDDTFYIMDYETFGYFAQLGFIAVKVDIRGTGGSQGTVPEREYSDTEMVDCESIIEQIAALPKSNGKVGMFGISWSGFNSLQMAMRRPPALKAIHAVHASDDLFHDDVHYVEGNFHIDPYHLFINHELGLPRTPHYKLDEEYFAERFDRQPWLFNYMNNQLDGPFWRTKSLREDYGQIDIPVYLMGGLLDPYRSAAVRMFEKLNVPVRCDVGPWEHSTPDGGNPGPNFEWQIRLCRWFDRYLRSDGKSAHPGKESMVYVRAGHAPDAEIEKVDGYWLKQGLTDSGARNVKFYLAGPGALSRKRMAAQPAAVAGRKAVAKGDELVYHPFAGTASGYWWGNRTGDQSGDDGLSLTYDTRILTRPLQFVGSPRLKVKVKSTSAKAKWTVRLEDVCPDGKVSLVTAATFNPAQAIAGRDRLHPAWPDADSVYEIDVPLHFSTWTFQPGHKMRVAIANAQFPIAWPSPETMVSTVFSADGSGALTLPVVPFNSGRRPHLPRLVDKKPYARDVEWLDFPGKPATRTFSRLDKKTGKQSHRLDNNSAYRIGKRKVFAETSNTWSTFDSQPWRSSYLGVAQTTIVQRGKNLRLRTRISVTSDQANFFVTVLRTLIQNGKVVRRRRFSETIARRFQ